MPEMAEEDFASLNLNDEEPVLTQRDLRSPSRAKNRQLKQKQKYYAYRAVHPSWVGQPYYTLVPVSEKPVKDKKGKASKQKGGTIVIEEEHPALEALLRRSTWELQQLLATTTEQAASEARQLTRSAEADLRERLTPEGTPVETIEAPKALAFLNKGFAQYSPACILRSRAADAFGEAPQNLRFKLKVLKWTRQDNFDMKESFISGPDRRHSKSRRQREKRAEKYVVACLGRRERQRQADARDIGSDATGSSDPVIAVTAESLHSTDEAAIADSSDTSHELSLAIVIERYEESVSSSPCSTPLTSGARSEREDYLDTDDYDVDDDTSQAMLTPTSTVSTSDHINSLADLLASTELVILPRYRRDDDMDSFRTDDISDLGDADAYIDIEWDIESA